MCALELLELLEVLAPDSRHIVSFPNILNNDHFTLYITYLHIHFFF